jgi:hypothetical protein
MLDRDRRDAGRRVIPAREASLRRVVRVVAAGRRAADGADPLGQAARAGLVATSGLSPEGVELALGAHLETNPARADLEALVASTGEAPRCHVVLAANVCTAALRAIAVAVATAPQVFVRPSRREPTLAVLLVEALAADSAFAAASGAVSCVEEVAPAPGDELHVYGSDETVQALGSTAPLGVVLRGHGTGLGVAVVGARDAIEHAAAAIASDVVPFDQHGCLSPRAVLVEGDAARAELLASALHASLADFARRVPRGPLSPDERAAVANYRASLEAVGVVWEGSDHLVGLDPAPRALVLPPATRTVHVVPASGSATLLAPWARFITCVGADRDGELAAAVRSLAPRARVACLGAMQRPPLDGPVDRRAG